MWLISLSAMATLPSHQAPIPASHRLRHALPQPTLASAHHIRLGGASSSQSQARDPTSSEPAAPQPPAQPSWALAGASRASVSLLAAATLAIAYPLLPVAPAMAAADNAAVGTCVLQKCQGALTKCLGDPLCLQNLVCLQACSTGPDETACQIRCGDRYDDKAVAVFNTCAVSEQKCVPQKVDNGLYPVPPDCALDRNFDLSAFQGRWYITAGLNPLFDIFPCQEHFFAAPKDANNTVYGEINWRIPVGLRGDFLQRSTMQRFVQDRTNPAMLQNHGNEYLHYEDDWYILASKPDEYVFVYYKGNNDAWKGYGGATVYTRSKTLPAEYIPELKAAAESAGLDWTQFQQTDNSCPTSPATRGPLEELEEDFEVAERFAAANLGSQLESFGKGFTVLANAVELEVEVLEQDFEDEEVAVVKELEEEAAAAGRLIKRIKMEASMGPIGKFVQALPLSIRELIMPIA